MSVFESILIAYFEGELSLTATEKTLVVRALHLFVDDLQDQLTTKDHTQEEVVELFNAWNLADRLIKRYAE